MEEQDSTAERNYSFGEYLPSAGIVGVIFALLTFAIGIFFGYQQINAEPTGSYFSPSMLSGVIICLVSAFAGMVAVWHFTKRAEEHTSELQSRGQLVCRLLLEKKKK